MKPSALALGLDSLAAKGSAVGNYSDLYLLCEATLNDGSPSGFSEAGDPQYGPVADLRRVAIPVLEFPYTLVTQVGAPPEWLAPATSGEGTAVPVHPAFLPSGDGIEVHQTVEVTPTASIRTVAVHHVDGTVAGFLKLHYPDCLGRFSRDLYHFKWLASLEADAAFREATESDGRIRSLPESFGWYAEGACTGQDRGWGALGRTLDREDLLAHPLMPAFSLITGKGDHWALRYLRDRYDWTISDARVHLIDNLMRVYVDLALDWGLLPECNAQNVLYTCDDQGNVSPIFRDMGDVFKDLTVRSARGLSCRFTAYKTIATDSDDLFQRRSFSYDFKLGEYIVSPLVKAISAVWGCDAIRLEKRVCQLGKETWGATAEEYFGDSGLWYSYPASRGVSRERYVAQVGPRYR